MSVLLLLIPVSVCLGLLGLGFSIWAIHSQQYTDPEGDARRILDNRFDERPLTKQDDNQGDEAHNSYGLSLVKGAEGFEKWQMAWTKKIAVLVMVRAKPFMPPIMMMNGACLFMMTSYYLKCLS